ncbi:MAG: hypothetical protein ACRC6U_00570, partial [Fusobacteriaceae bacterium]
QMSLEVQKNYIQCDSIQELKNSYKKLHHLRKSIKHDFKNTKLKSWKSAWDLILELKIFVYTELKIYALTNLNNPARAKIIGLTKIDLEDKKEFKKWKNEIIKEIHPDLHNNSEINKKASQKLNEIIKEREVLCQK